MFNWRKTITIHKDYYDDRRQLIGADYILECGHIVFSRDMRDYDYRKCDQCPPVNTDYWEWNGRRYEWIDDQGVGHYDPRFVKNSSHSCNGNCSRDDFPGKIINFDEE